jgi:hypothetical protein
MENREFPMKALRSSIAAALAVTVALTAVNLGPAQAAPAKQPQAKPAETLDLSAHRRHYRHYRNDRAALQMFGMVAGTIAGIAAAEQSRRHYRHGYGHYGYHDYPPHYYGHGHYYRY